MNGHINKVRIDCSYSKLRTLPISYIHKVKVKINKTSTLILSTEPCQYLSLDIK